MIVVYFGKIYFEQIKLGKTISNVFILTKIILATIYLGKNYFN